MTKKTPGLKFKGLYDVGCLAELMCHLNWAHDQAVWEKACEGDDSEVPGKLADVLHMLGETLIAMTAEEVAECLASVDGRMDDGAPELMEMGVSANVRKFRVGRMVTKAGRKVSAATAAVIQDAMDSHDNMAKAMKEHTKCMKSLMAVTEDDDNTETQSSGETGTAGDTSKGIDLVSDKAQRIKRAKALAVPRA